MVQRRKFLTVVGTGVGASIAGCMGGDGNDGGDGSSGNGGSDGGDGDGGSDGSDGGGQTTRQQQGGRVFLYVTEPWPQAIMDESDFVERTGIEIDFQVIVADTLAQYRADYEAGQAIADLVQEQNGQVGVWEREGYAASHEVDNRADLMTDLEREKVRGILDDPNTGTPIYKAAEITVYNSELVSEPPIEWEDFLDDRWDGTLVTPPYVMDNQLAMLTDYWGEAEAEQYIKDFDNQNPSYVRGMNNNIQRVLSQQSQVGVNIIDNYIASRIEEGAPLDIAMPPMVPGLHHFAVIPQNAPHPEAARTFLDFICSEEGQQALAAGHKAWPIIPELEHGSPAMAERISQWDSEIWPYLFPAEREEYFVKRVGELIGI